MEKIEFDELLSNIKSTRNVNEIKQKLDREKWIDSKEKEKMELKKNKRFKQKRRFHNKDEEEEADELEEAIEKQKIDKKRKKVLDAPIHRQAQQRIEGKLAYRQIRNDLHQWQPIVNNLRVAEQLQFPENDRTTDNPLKSQTTEERAKQFVPRTELEQRIADILGKSKWNIKNGEEFSQAEREMLKTMELKEARRKCQELRKMRALMTFHAAKQKRQSKIKSKTFHRIRKRQERREMVKEIGTLLVENPTKATERIEQLEKDRAYERATLKHRGTNKWTKQIRKFATRNPELRKAIEDQLRLGRELKGLHGAEGTENDNDQISEESSTEGNDADKTLSTQKLVQMAVIEADRDNNDDKPMPRACENPFYRSALENIRRERKQLASEAKQRAANKIKRKDPTDEGAIEKIVKEQTKNGDGETQKTNEPEFLDLNLRQIVQIPAELADGADSDIDVHHAFLAEAYEDDDVIGDFDLRKKRVEANEAPKEKNNRRAAMQGWGSWTGPGISQEKEKKRIDKILGERPDKRKMRALKRRDAQMRGLIIREQVSEGIQKLQPKDVPFPFTRIQDFEAYIQQPLGRDWNTPVAVKQLTKPFIKTKSGRIIRPLNKNLKQDKNVLEVIGEEE